MRHVDDRWCFAFVQSQFQHLFPITSHRHKASRRILPSAFAWFESICTLDFTVWVFQDRKEQLSGVGICYVGMLATFVILCLSLTSKISKVVSVALDSRNIKKPWFRRARHQSRKFRRVSSSANVVFHNKNKFQENEESAKPQHLGHEDGSTIYVQFCLHVLWPRILFAQLMFGKDNIMILSKLKNKSFPRGLWAGWFPLQAAGQGAHEAEAGPVCC